MSLASTAPRHLGIAARVVLAGPVAVVVTLLVLAGMPLWMPAGAAGIDHLILPLLILPASWAALFFQALLDRRLARVALVALALASLNAVMLARHFAAPSTPQASEAKP